jgi:transposase
MFMLMIQHQPHGSLAYFRGELVRRLAHDGSTFSGVGASGKPGAVHTANRKGLRYPSDLTDDEWALVAPMIPPARHGGRKRSVDVREVVNGIFYVLWTGCQWKALPKDLPPKSTVHDYLELWNWDGTLERIHHALYVAVREQEGREASPTAAIIDSQTAKGAQKGGLGSILQATTRARRSKVVSGTSWSTRWASC